QARGGRPRLGGPRPTPPLAVGGEPILARSVRAFVSHASIDEVVVALPRDLVDAPPSYLLTADKPVRLVTGGARRQDSVANGFGAADPVSEIIVVHDAARPFVSAALTSRTIAAAPAWGAALAATAARDTVKRTSQRAGDSARTVDETLSRDAVYLAQTPQAFRREVLRAALAVASRDGIDATD